MSGRAWQAAGGEVDRRIADGRFAGLHALVVRQAGRTVLERYYRGRDFSWGRDLGEIDFAPAVLHDLRSVSKSVVGLLYGIALAEGWVPGPDAPLLDSFPDYRDLAAEPARRDWQVRHALTMSLGTEWDESAPYTGPENSEIAMEMAPDRYRFILDRPLREAAGAVWRYNGGATALLADLIYRGTGRDLLDYGREKLLQPLGIQASEWISGSNGRAAAASGLRLAAPDLARLGELLLQDGAWAGRQIVPADWLRQSLTPQLAIDGEFAYGFQWWLAGFLGPDRPWIAAHGNGGQRLIVLPHANLVMVCFTGNYDQPAQAELPIALMRDIVLPIVF